MQAKPFFFDCETTGLDEKKNEIIQMSFEYAGDIRTYYCKPMRPENIDDEALRVNGYTREQIMAFPPPQEALIDILSFLDSRINKFKREDKAVFIAHNASFDWSMFTEFFYAYVSRTEPDPEKPGKLKPDIFLGNYFITAPMCTVHSYSAAVAIGKLPKPKKFKLGILLDAHGIKIEKAHDAKYDMLAMRDLFYDIICPALGWPWKKNALNVAAVAPLFK